MRNAEYNNADILRSIVNNTSVTDNIVSFGYYISSKQDHLYNLGYYINELDNYRAFAGLLCDRNKLCNDIIVLFKKQYSNLWSNKAIYGLKNTGIELEIICDELFSFSYPINTSGNNSVNIDEKLAENIMLSAIKSNSIGIKVIINTNEDCYIDINKRIDLSNKGTKKILNEVIKTIKTACNIHIKRKFNESKK